MSETNASRSGTTALDAKAAASRRKKAAAIRDAREKLTSSGSGRRTFDIELLRDYAESRVAAAPVAITIIAMVAAVLALWAPLLHIWLWLTAIIGQSYIAYRFYNRIRRLSDSEIALATTHRKIVILEASQGVVLAMLGLLLVGSPDEAARGFMFFALLLLSAVSAMVLALVPAAVFANLLPITASTIVAVLATSYNPLPQILIVVAAFGYFLFLSRRFYATSLASLTLRLEKDSLIAELEQAKANSDEARRRAEESSLAKSRFLATMSHELRTPLNAILGFSEVMKCELFGTHAVPAYKGYSADIHSSGQHLLALINEILDLSRVEAGRYELKEDAVSLALIVEDCTHLLSLRAEKREITITETIEPKLPRLWADERAVRQVTLNLLTNAIKFTPPGGAVFIKVGWTAVGGQYMSIRDTGTGIPAEEIPIVLSSFGRGSLAQKNADEGSGLGLPIVKGLVELHGGTFNLKSEVRVGTEVIVIFPPERVMETLAQVDVSEPRQHAGRKAA